MNEDIKQILERLYEIAQAPLMFFDIESTGIDKVNDEIIQLYLCKYDGKDFIEHNSYYNTDVQIREEAYEKHGIRNEDLKQYPYFKEDAQMIYDTFFGKDVVLCGFNSNHFDNPMIVEQFNKYEVKGAFSIFQNQTIDAYTIYRLMHPNTLEGVYDRLVGGDMGNAHEAKTDIMATIRIVGKLLDIESDVDIITKPEHLDSDKFFKREGNEIFFAKGKLKGQNILTMDANEAKGFLGWMTRTQDISIHSRTLAGKLIKKINEINENK